MRVVKSVMVSDKSVVVRRGEWLLSVVVSDKGGEECGGEWKGWSGFLSGFGPRGGKTAICNLVGGMALSTCTALDNVAESGGILNPPPNFESFLFRASCVISGVKMHSVIWFLFHHTLV